MSSSHQSGHDLSLESDKQLGNNIYWFNVLTMGVGRL